MRHSCSEVNTLLKFCSARERLSHEWFLHQPRPNAACLIQRSGVVESNLLLSLQYKCCHSRHIALILLSVTWLKNSQRLQSPVGFCEKQEESWSPSLPGPRFPDPPGTSPVLWTGWVWKWSRTRHTQSAGSPGSPWSPPRSGVRNNMEQNTHHSAGLLQSWVVILARIFSMTWNDFSRLDFQLSSTGCFSAWGLDVLPSAVMTSYILHPIFSN